MTGRELVGQALPRAGRLASAAACVGLLALASCAPPAFERPASEPLAPPRERFDLSGRLSARHSTESLSANFRWQHDGARDEFELGTPLGQTLARLTSDGSGVELVLSNGRVERASDWATLTERGLGWPLPVAGLVYWIQGAPREGAPYLLDVDDNRDPNVLRQDGWTIAYQSFAVTDEGTRRPARMTLSYPDVELRLVIDKVQ